VKFLAKGMTRSNRTRITAAVKRWKERSQSKRTRALGKNSYRKKQKSQTPVAKRKQTRKAPWQVRIESRKYQMDIVDDEKHPIEVLVDAAIEDDDNTPPLYTQEEVIEIRSRWFGQDNGRSNSRRSDFTTRTESDSTLEPST